MKERGGQHHLHGRDLVFVQASGNVGPIRRWRHQVPVPAVFDPAANIVVQAGSHRGPDQPVVDALVFSVQAGASTTTWHVATRSTLAAIGLGTASSSHRMAE